MKGDFTRDTFEPAKHFSRVLMQQGRVTLDADFNEQAAISLRYLRTLARDIIGPYAAPAGKDANGDDLGGFKLTKLDPDPDKGLFSISKGCYYVNGILVENDTDDCTYKTQPDYEPPANDLLLKATAEGSTQPFFVYLDVWERHITALEDNSICEKGLGGPNTCTRAKVIWQVKSAAFNDSDSGWQDVQQEVQTDINNLFTTKANLESDLQTETDPIKKVGLFVQIQALDEQLRFALLPVHEALLKNLTSISNAKLAARVDPGRKTEDACVTPPASKYRGTENQLYRVEIHQGGQVGDNPPPTFKWSRDNGSVATAWLGGEGSDLQVASTRGFAAGNWVELSDDTSDLLGTPGTLVQLVKVEDGTLSVDPTMLPPFSDFLKNPKVRRWDHIANDTISLADDHAIPIQESSPAATPEKIVWIDLEDGVQIQFSAGGVYRTGDYWLIPARVATGNVEWPLQTDADGKPKKDSAGNFVPLEQSPHGIEHHYALLGFASWPQPNQKLKIEDARFEFWPLMSRVVESALSGTPDYHLVQPTSPPGAEPSKPAPKPKKGRAKKVSASAKGAPS